ncbi:MAG: cell division protein FtsA [Rhodomicrobium sp.]
MMAARRYASRGPSRLWPFKARDDIVTVVDLGAQKVACAIACLTAPRFGLDIGARNVRVLGNAIVRSSGFSDGRIVNIAAAETAVRRAVAQAESEAGITAGEVVVTGQFDGLSAQVFEAKPADGESALSKEDAAVIWAAAEDECRLVQRKLLHIFTFAAGEPVTPFTAASEAPQDEVDVAAISMPLKGANQVTACFARSMLAVRGLIAGPLACALAVTDSLERLAGVLVVDLGAHSTGYALFFKGVPVFMECIGLGGDHITSDIARAFSLRKFEAERLKIRFGSIYDGLAADIDLPARNGETGDAISKTSLNHLIRSNASLIFTAINERLKGAGYSIPSGGAVLTGGGSLLPGMRDLASQLLSSEVRMAGPIALNGLNAGNPLAALVGGCLYASRHQSQGEMAHAPGIVSQDSSYASRISQWLKASF